jgi:hypothetical protein
LAWRLTCVPGTVHFSRTSTIQHAKIASSSSIIAARCSNKDCCVFLHEPPESAQAWFDMPPRDRNTLMQLHFEPPPYPGEEVASFPSIRHFEPVASMGVCSTTSLSKRRYRQGYLPGRLPIDAANFPTVHMLASLWERGVVHIIPGIKPRNSPVSIQTLKLFARSQSSVINSSLHVTIP